MKTFIPAASHPFFIEPLEGRVAPAGVVAFTYDAASGALALTGDTDNNLVRIFPSGPGTHRVEGIGTTFTGAATFLDFGKLTSVIFAGNQGGDFVHLQDMSLTTVSFSGGDGAD